MELAVCNTVYHKEDGSHFIYLFCRDRQGHRHVVKQSMPTVPVYVDESKITSKMKVKEKYIPGYKEQDLGRVKIYRQKCAVNEGINISAAAVLAIGLIVKKIVPLFTVQAF